MIVLVHPAKTIGFALLATSLIVLSACSKPSPLIGSFEGEAKVLKDKAYPGFRASVTKVESKAGDDLHLTLDGAPLTKPCTSRLVSPEGKTAGVVGPLSCEVKRASGKTESLSLNGTVELVGLDDLKGTLTAEALPPPDFFAISFQGSRKK